MKKVLLYIWQLPQNLFGLILRVVFLLKYGEPETDEYNGIKYLYYEKWTGGGVSLGNQVLLSSLKREREDSKLHEYGHTRQSLYLGPLYLLIIGIPSGLGCLWHNYLHTVDRGWSVERAYWWYYNQPWEFWADRLGNVDRKYKTTHEE